MVGNSVKRFIAQRYHRNGVSGDGAVVTEFVPKGATYHLIAVTLMPEFNDSLTPSGGDSAPPDEWVRQWVSVFATRTVVITPTDVTEPWRGADLWGPEIAHEYRRRCMEATNEWDRYDPAMERYNDVHADPEEVARLVAENDAAVEELFGLPKGTLT
jgi:hypothetical protein